MTKKPAHKPSKKPVKKPTKTSSGKSTGKSSNNPTDSEKLINAAFKLASTTNWSMISMNDIADEAQVSRDKSQNLYRNKEAIISDVMKRANNAALADSLEFQENDSIKDKLFSLMMARFDYLAPYRKGIARIIKSSNRSPLQALARLPQVMKTMNLMLQTAGVRTNSPSGIIKINGLTLISANAMWVWLHDETVDLTPTMVALDKGLSRADTLIGKVFLCSAQ